MVNQATGARKKRCKTEGAEPHDPPGNPGHRSMPAQIGRSANRDYAPQLIRSLLRRLIAVLLAHLVTTVPFFFQFFIGKVRMVTIGRGCAFHACIHSCLSRRSVCDMVKWFESLRYHGVQTYKIKLASHWSHSFRKNCEYQVVST